MTGNNGELSFEEFSSEVLADLKLAYLSRYCSLIGQKGGFFGESQVRNISVTGRKLPRLPWQKIFKDGDWRSGYYRDQTFLMATGMSDAVEFFSQVYGDTDLGFNPSNGGRSFNNHYASRSLNPDGSWKHLSEMKNTAADLSPVAGQMPRLIGLGLASKLFRQNPQLQSYTNLSHGGNEVAFGTIGDASTAEGHFFETINAAAVLQIPVAVAVWDDGYGISVTKDLQIVKASVSEGIKRFCQGRGQQWHPFILRARLGLSRAGQDVQ